MKKIILWILVIIWMVVIFYFSSQNAIESTNNSRAIINSAKIIDKYQTTENKKEEMIEKADLYFREFAHACEFLILSIFICLLLKNYNLKSKKILIISILICLIYSCIDEFHQLFVHGRSFELKDILLDNIGSVIGNTIFYIFNRRK